VLTLIPLYWYIIFVPVVTGQLKPEKILEKGVRGGHTPRTHAFFKGF
jgi:hypothetical protein